MIGNVAAILRRPRETKPLANSPGCPRLLVRGREGRRKFVSGGDCSEMVLSSRIQNISPPKAAKFLSESRSEFQTKNTYPTGAQDGQSLRRDLLRSGCSPNDRATRGRSRKAEPLPRGSFFSSPISQWRGNGCFFVAVFGEPQGVAVDSNKQSHCHGSQM